ncbi:MAG: hypothetical protein HY907_19545 [Deltaproteobacteria bacterium]|nr:hypothetical protein [Deltaproteobacteria bacterium]
MHRTLGAPFLSLCALLPLCVLPSCRKPDTGRPDTGGPLVVVQAPDVAEPPPPAPPPAEGAYCVENWRVALPPDARLLDVARLGSQAALLLEQDGTFIAVAVGGGGQSTAAILQDFVPSFTGERTPWGLLVQGDGRVLALYGWVRTRENASLFGRVIKPDGALNPAVDAESARKRYFVARPKPDWELPGDPIVPESRLWTAGIEGRFLVVANLWVRDRLEAGRVVPVKKHLFSIFGGTGKRAGGWDMRTYRGGSPAVLGDRFVVALASNDRKYEIIGADGRRQNSGPLFEALGADPSWLPLAGGCLPGAAAPADGGTPGCFGLFVQGDLPAVGLPELRALYADGSALDWSLPADLAAQSVFETVADGLLWALAPDGSVWAAGADGSVGQRTRLPEGALYRRYGRQEILVAVAGASGVPGLVVSCVPGGAQPAPARGVALDGTVAQARRDAAGLWNESALASLDEIQEALAGGATPGGDGPASADALDDARQMAERARVLDPEMLVASLTLARAETLALDMEAARREFGGVDVADPGRRDRLYRLACADARFAALRWHPELGSTIRCPEAPPEWFVRLTQPASAEDDDAWGAGVILDAAGGVMPGFDLVPPPPPVLPSALDAGPPVVPPAIGVAPKDAVP